MIININIDIELNKEQVSFLRKFYIDKSTRQFHISSKPGQGVGWSFSPDNIITSVLGTLESLVDRDILKKDNMMNYTLTLLGHYIIDKIDRDKIIDRIINNE
jgi:hypothetical protein